MIEYPNFLNKIFDKLEKNGARTIIIGGFIRDYLLKSESDDIDIEVYNISSFEKLENILKEFGTVNRVGKSFGVCKVNIENFVLDFTLPRIDSKIASGHSGFDIKIEKNLD
nr:CCA tRNA nucleotidyltransferase [Sulfurimonas sp.]